MLYKNVKRENMKSNKSKNRTAFTERVAPDSEAEPTSAGIRNLLQHSDDVVIRELYIDGQKNLPVTMAFIDGMVDIKSVDEDVLKPLTQGASLSDCKDITEIIDRIEHGALYHASQKTRNSLPDCINDIIDGSVALIFDQVNKAVTFDVKGFDKRKITEPTGENVIKGAKDSFIENIRTNTATVRSKIKTDRLVIEEMRIGQQSSTKIDVVYIKGVANKHIVEELKGRLEGIVTDGVLSSGVVEENIIDHKYSPFPQVIYTERSDKFCSNIIEGRVGIIIDGLPVTLIIPGTFETFIQAPEDYSQNFIISSIIRLLRFMLVSVTLFLPGFYVSISTFHQEMIPTELALAISASKEGVPFYTFVEVIFMLLAFEILVEAGLRLPKNIGQAVSIVGAVVVGQAAVEARFVSPSVVVIIAITAISSFTMPNQDISNALRLWRFILVILSSLTGLFGLSIGGLLLFHHLSYMEVYGVPYLSPFVGEDNKEMQDSLIRLPFSFQYKRPLSLRTVNKKRHGRDGDGIA